MSLPIELISTDFDGTLYAEFERPPVPESLQELIAGLQKAGVKWVINTGRELTGLMEAIARARLRVRPDYLVLVEREIYVHRGGVYEGLEPWNHSCTRDHARLFERVKADVPKLTSWIEERFQADVYEDPWSPFCLVAQNNEDASAIVAYLDSYCAQVPHLSVMRNDVYARLNHTAYSKGTALSEIVRMLGVNKEAVFAVGDHFNDLPMLLRQHAGLLAAPANAMPEVKKAVVAQGGYVSQLECGHGVEEALRLHLGMGLNGIQE